VEGAEVANKARSSVFRRRSKGSVWLCCSSEDADGEVFNMAQAALTVKGRIDIGEEDEGEPAKLPMLLLLLRRLESPRLLS